MTRRAEDGKPQHHELVSLTKTSDGTGEYDIKSVYKPASAPSAGPAKVSSDAYRSGWETIFGAKRAALN